MTFLHVKKFMDFLLHQKKKYISEIDDDLKIVRFLFFRKQIILTRLNNTSNLVRLPKYKGPTAVNLVNYAGGSMLRLVNDRPRSRWSQLGHQGWRKRARITVLWDLWWTSWRSVTISTGQLDFSSVIWTSYKSITSCKDLSPRSLLKKR